jgi:hypothetical protein
MRAAYHSIRSSTGTQSHVLRNALLTSVVFQNSTVLQSHIVRALGASWYLVKKALAAHGQVNRAGEAFGEGYHGKGVPMYWTN